MVRQARKGVEFVPVIDKNKWPSYEGTKMRLLGVITYLTMYTSFKKGMSISFSTATLICGEKLYEISYIDDMVINLRVNVRRQLVFYDSVLVKKCSNVICSLK